MSEFDACHAFDLGYGYAVRGIIHMPIGTWLDKFAADWKAGYEQAKQDGRWGTYCP